MKSRFYTFDDHLKEMLKDPKFKKTWNDSETERSLGSALMGKIIQKKVDSKILAKKSKISQKTINKILYSDSNPKLSTLKNLASALGSKLVVKLE